MSTRKVLCIDGHNILVRAVKAAEGRVELSAGGYNTAPTLLFINMLSKYVRQEHPDQLIVCWDGGRSTYRQDLFPAYKLARHTHEVEEDYLHSHLSRVREFLSLAGIHHVQVPHFEADDLVAYYWRIRKAGDRFIIVSGDKDFLQLLDGWTEQIRPGQTEERWTANRVRSEMKCKPEHLPYVMALTGDKVDGIPGVPGFGHKTACKFLAQYDWSLNALLAANEPKLNGYADDVRCNLALVNLRDTMAGAKLDLPAIPALDLTTINSPLWTMLLSWCEQYAMASVHDRLVAEALWSETPRSGRRLDGSTLFA